MALSADEVLEEIGSFGWFQKRLLILFNLLSALLFGWAVMVTGIITAEPPWECAKNSSVCTFDNAIRPGDDNYDHRCNISRSEWNFVDELTTVVTEVTKRTFFSTWLDNCWNSLTLLAEIFILPLLFRSLFGAVFTVVVFW